MSPTLLYFAWTYFRAAIWIGAAAYALRRATGNRVVARGYVLAHAAALAAGALGDVYLVNFAPRSWLRLEVMQWVFVAPIAVFTGISLWIGSWEVSVEPPDVFMTLVPIVAWGLLVIYGWQSLWYCHVLGAWFVSAACGAVDLWTRYGAARFRAASYRWRFAGYAAVVAVVYLVLPRTQ